LFAVNSSIKTLDSLNGMRCGGREGSYASVSRSRCAMVALESREACVDFPEPEFPNSKILLTTSPPRF
jgi:hypothetical protein